MDSTATVESATTSHAVEDVEDAPVAAPSLLEQDLLVEDVSIDGMCGVY